MSGNSIWHELVAKMGRAGVPWNDWPGDSPNDRMLNCINAYIDDDRISNAENLLIKKRSDAWEALIVFMADRRVHWENWPGNDGAEKMLNCIESHVQAVRVYANGSLKGAVADPVQDVKDAVAYVNAYKREVEVFSAQVDACARDAHMRVIDDRLDLIVHRLDMLERANATRS